MVLSVTAMRDGGGAIGFGRRSVAEAIALAMQLEREGFTRVIVTDLDTKKQHWPSRSETATSFVEALEIILDAEEFSSGPMHFADQWPFTMLSPFKTFGIVSPDECEHCGA